ncbi:MAG: hypothetical protein WC421_09370 [Elusimicrobiales bacterium]
MTHLNTWRSKLLFFALVSCALVTVLFVLQGRTGVNLSDEGYLWYGAQRVAAGEVPIRDFASYDPGRYYWTAAFMRLSGNNGIVSLRVAAAVFQAVGLFVAMIALARLPQRKNSVFWIMASAVLLLWMFPRHKLFDTTISISLVAVLAYLAEQPSAARYFLTGIVVGLAAFFGRNHGVYGAIGSLCLLAYLSAGGGAVRWYANFAWWLSGVVAGYCPMLAVLAAAPGFYGAFRDSVRLIIETKTTNIPLPVPWPWISFFSELPLYQSIRGTIIGLLFMGMAAFGVFGIVRAIRARINKTPVTPLFLGAAFMAVPYAHYAFSRADVGHLPDIHRLHRQRNVFPRRCGASGSWHFPAAAWNLCFYIRVSGGDPANPARRRAGGEYSRYASNASGLAGFP